MPTTYLYIAVILYIIAGSAVALMARREMNEGIVEYFLSGRNTGGFVAALSYSATTYSAFMMIGLAGFTYSGGVGALGFELVYLSGLSLVAFFGPRFWLIGKKNNYVSPYEMLGDRYQNQWIAFAASLSACVFLIPYLAVQLMGVGYLLSGLSGGEIPFFFGVVIAVVLAIAWALIAGMKSVTWTDSLQSLIMIVVSIIILFYVIYQHLGGFAEFFGSLAALEGDVLSVPGPGFFSFKTFLGLSLPWFFFSISNPQVSQRLFIPRDLKAMKTMIKGFLIFGFIYTMVSVIWGFSARLLIPGLSNADLATPELLASEYVPTVLALVAMIGITAAAISTIDSIMLTLSSLVVRDIFKNMEDNLDRDQNLRQLRTAKIAILLIALLGFFFAIQELDLIATLSVAASVGLLVVVPSMFGAFFWKKATAAGSLSSIIFGSLTALYLQFSGWRPLGHWAGVWTLIVTAAVFVGVSFFTQAPADKAEEFIGYLNRECKERNII
ncbi:SSS family solute:Na+ symporter [Halanaerobium saccharolyticum]|uniref:SSS family solute:Na+ symporter n=1 Tax=Halanaerobium saccharolyticum TaxID=43595 RepID=A0A2T5RSY5_9FIRM|nr:MULTISPECIES: sodium:solute symporter family protein [Halanaerobium]PTW03453.1 SSS family solute:Na+ symporter [Halanaerobium saccharolyticum]PUU93138.1 MAG: solute:Na+ symporter, SSS family [Halanaerobium sp.]